MIEIKITGANAQETLEELRGLAKGFFGEPVEVKQSIPKLEEPPKAVENETTEVEEPEEKPKAESSGKSKTPKTTPKEEKAVIREPEYTVAATTCPEDVEEPPAEEPPKEEPPAKEPPKDDGDKVPTAEEIRAMITERSNKEAGFKVKAKNCLEKVGAKTISSMTEEQRKKYVELLESTDDDDDVPF